MFNKKDQQDVINIDALSPKQIGVAIMLASILIIAGLTAFMYARELNLEKATLYDGEQNRIEIMEQYIDSKLQIVETDLHLAATQEKLSSYFNTNDPKDLTRLAKEYLEMSIAKTHYDQIRYLDENGMEKVRINYNNGSPAIVATDNLQNKKDRYYFSDTFSLNEGEIFVSPLDLNIENGEIEDPLKAMIRFGTPLFDKQGNRKGIILLNYLANDLLNGIDDLYLQEKGQLLFLNQDGYWIKALNPDDEWGFMYENRNNKIIQNTHPEAWKKIQKEDSDQFILTSGLYTYSKIFPLTLKQISSSGSLEHDKASEREIKNNQYSWTIISHIKPAQIGDGALSLLYTTLVIDLALLAIILFLTWKLTHAIKAKRKAEKNILELYELLKIINKMLRHDILGKLTGIRAGLESSELIPTEPIIEEVYKHVKNSIQLVEQMKELEATTNTNRTLKSYDISQVFEDIANEQKMTINTKGNAQIMADQALYSVFENLARNAQIHGGVNTIEVNTTKDSDYITIKISDEGSGIPKDIREKVFEEGYTAGQTGNTGLGLFIVKKTIERYEGKIHIEENHPRGTIFIIQFPNES